MGGRYGTLSKYRKSKFCRIFPDAVLCGQITAVNKLLKKDITEKFVCNSRARRFGKSVTADMLVAYFSKGADSRHLDRDVQSAVRRARGLDEAVSAVLVGHGHLRGYRRPDQQKF